MAKNPNPIDVHVGGRVRMRRLMLKMSQTNLADGLSLTFQQVQKYENGKNRMGASRLQHIAHILQVPVHFFFEGLPSSSKSSNPTDAGMPEYVSKYLASSDGLTLTKSFMAIKNAGLRKAIVGLVEDVASRYGD